MPKPHYINLLLCLFLLSSCHGQNSQKEKDFVIQKTDQEWKSTLTVSEYQVLRKAGTERPFTGAYYLHFEDGIYRCAACGAKLFKSTSKFRSDCGWPSFDRVIDSAIIRRPDYKLGYKRTEIICANCGGHLGHVFKDGPTDTGLRYCINSISLDFSKEK